MAVEAPETAPPPAPQPQPEQPDLFVSYSRKDSLFVRRLAAELDARGKTAWVDWEDIPPTADWLAEIEAGIEAAAAFAFVITPDSLASRVCARELDHALAQGKRIVPILCRDPDGEAVPEALASRNWIFARDSDDEEASIETLVHALDTDLEWVRVHTRLLVRAREWQQRRGDRSLLLRGAELRDAEQWLARVEAAVEPQPTPLQREFALASRHGESRRQRIVLASVAAALVVTGLLAALAWIQRGQAIDNARTARSRELSARADEYLGSDPVGSMFLALKGLDEKRTPEAESALRHAVAFSHLQLALRGHRGWVSHAEYSPDGRRVLTASRDRTARVWRARDGRLLRTLGGHTGAVAATFSHNGRLVATASRDRTARIWSASTGRTLHVLRGHTGWVSGAAFSPDDTVLLTWSRDGTARTWDVRTGRALRSLRGHRRWVSTGAFTGDGLFAVTGSDDGTTRIWSTSTGRTVAVLRHRDVVIRVAGGAAGRVASAAYDGSVLLWDPRTRKARTVGDATGEVVFVGFSPRGRYLVTGNVDGSAGLWDAASAARVRSLLGHTGPVVDAAFTHDDLVVATAGGDGTARLWEAAGGGEAATLNGHDGWVTSVDLSPDGKHVLTASRDGTARIWDATAGRGRALRSEGATMDAAFSPDGRSLLVIGIGSGRLYDARSGLLLKSLPLVREAAFTRDGTRLLVGGLDLALLRLQPRRVLWSKPGPVGDVELGPAGATLVAVSGDGTASLRDVESGRLVRVLRARGAVQRVSFSRDGSRIVTLGDDGTAAVWDARDGRRLSVLSGPLPAAGTIELDPDGKLVVAAGGGDVTARIWDAADGALLHVLRGHANIVTAARFSPDGMLVATASADNTVRLWDSFTGRVLLTLRAHKKPVDDVRFAPDGRCLVSAGQDGTARVWEVPTGRELARLGGGGHLLHAVFSADGARVATADVDGHSRVYDTPACAAAETMRRNARRVVDRLLTRTDQAALLNAGGDWAEAVEAERAARPRSTGAGHGAGTAPSPSWASPELSAPKRVRASSR